MTTDPSTTATSPTKSYYLSCHCQQHIATLSLPIDNPFPDNGVCDCSHCLRRRIVWAVAPSGSLKVVKGFDGLREYQFGKKEFIHYFCDKCGTLMPSPDAESSGKQIMYNLRALRDPEFDLWALPMTLYPGLNRPGSYIEPTLSSLPPQAKEYLETRQQAYEHPTEIYAGACHCQAVKFGVVSRRLEDRKCRIMDCCCSLCQGNGALWIYPSRKDVFFHPPLPETPYVPQPDLLTEYGFLKHENLHYHCKTCGCNVFEYRTRPDEDPRPERARKTPWGPENGWNGSFGLNIGLLSNVGEYLGDVLGLGVLGQKEGRAAGKEGREWKAGVLEIQRDPVDRLEEPRYKVEA